MKHCIEGYYFIQWKNNINKKGGQEKQTKLLKRTKKRKCSERALGWEPGAYSFGQITTLNPKICNWTKITSQSLIKILWKEKQLKEKHSNENLWEKIGNRHIYNKTATEQQKMIFRLIFFSLNTCIVENSRNTPSRKTVGSLIHWPENPNR